MPYLNVNISIERVDEEAFKFFEIQDMKSINTLLAIKRKALPVLKRHAVKHASIFGSFARGDSNDKSDIDLLIEYKEDNKSLFDFINLKSELEESLGRKVDLVTYNSIYWRLRDTILAEQVKIL